MFGNVGIGTATPTEKLDVTGHINSSETYKLDESTVLSNRGSENIFVGEGAGASNTTGYMNTASGHLALQSNTTGYYNTGFGAIADVSAGDLANATAIGYWAVVDSSNKVRIGNSSVTSNGGQVVWTAYSDGRYKRDVREDVPGIAFITKLRPITYHWDIHKMNDAIYGQDTTMWDGKYDIEKIKWTGFIAQDVERAAAECNYDFSGVDNSGDIKGLRYAEFVVPLVKAVQEQQKTIKDLGQENGELQAQIDELRREITEMKGTK